MANKKQYIVLFVLLLQLPSHVIQSFDPDDTVTIPTKIWINRERDEIVPWICDYLNDVHWRIEVDDMILLDSSHDGDEPAVGNIYYEVANVGKIFPLPLYKNKYFNTTGELVVLDLPSNCQGVTQPDADFYLLSNRQFQEKNGGTTEFLYEVTMDSDYANEMFGIPAPGDLAQPFGQAFLTLNLIKLKALLEGKDAPV